ncbi:TetR/AcrR family transcriptional regulator [Dietzia sp. B19]|uniref:TetR/AcrR family transcriptional regulator n=1 Tax=Dietzia sp. B19 TaxID=1630632 RepID=UPI001F50BC85|nr:TetR/AcrR family transcriptional regulator [Dietzia sp. B19]
MGKRDEARAETIERILAAAREEIARAGGVGLSMRSVAREVGMVSSAIYRYFPSREDLLTAMILESYQGLAVALRPAEAESEAESEAEAEAETADEGGDAAAGTTAENEDGDAATGNPDSGSDAERWRRLADALRGWGLGAPHEFQLIYGTPIPGYVAPAETIPAAGEVAAPFLSCLRSRHVPGFESAGTGMSAFADDARVTPSTAAAAVAAISELIGFVGHELAGHFVGLADPADDLYRAVVARQVRDLGLESAADDDELLWNSIFGQAFARHLALYPAPGMETAHPDDSPYRVDELTMTDGAVTLVWSYPEIRSARGGPVRVGRHWNLRELREGFSPSDPEFVAGAVIDEDFMPLALPSADREGPDGIRWLGPPPPA